LCENQLKYSYTFFQPPPATEEDIANTRQQSYIEKARHLEREKQTNMKYGEHLKANVAPEYGIEAYINYERLDHIIAELSKTKPSRYDRLIIYCETSFFFLKFTALIVD
jgi:hypothetical protein